ncbi:MAG: UvrD-helicase domain-containing protein [Oscillospiraceae bacterium]|nr:UvrD-helicase domain-containing protein [Oscillospiraceae bacterium]
MQFTEAQENAINAKTGTLLVSAGAGSGKTSVLTERIIKKISAAARGVHETDVCDITDFLVVTFTRASATDLKNKISNAINKKLSEDINNVHLKRQQILLSRASISTIHSFCLDLIRANFEKLGLPAKFRISDENEMSIIKRSLLDDLLDKYYDGGSEIYTEKSPEDALFSYSDFIFAIENFLGARDDENIYGVILKIYNKITSAIDGLKLFDDQIKIMREIIDFDVGGRIARPQILHGRPMAAPTSFFNTKFGESIRDLLWDNIQDCILELKKMTAQISAVKFEVLDKKYSGCLYNMRNFFAQLTKILDKNNLYLYDDAYNLCENYENIKVGTNRIDKDDTEALELKEILDKNIKYIREIISYIQKLFSHDFADIKRFAASYERSLVVLRDFTGRFDDILNAEKMRLKSFEFSDLERFAVKLLIEKIGENGEIYTTDLAKQVKGNYKEIYIDEYQDTNKMQDIIFRAISTEYDNSENGNRFMVGDIKQSIYAFRGAKPDIFAGYSKSFEEYGETQTPVVSGDTPFQKGAKPHKIYLKKNFRSSKNIIDFINYIFSALFSEKLGGIEYTGGEVLEAGRIFDDNVGRDDPGAPFENIYDVTFAIIEKSREENLSDSDKEEAEKGTEDNGENEIIDYDVEDDVLNSVVSAEAEYVALTIKKLLGSGKLKNGEKILPRHITVLMRNYTKSEIYVDALKKYEIACYTDRAKGFLSSAEIMLVVSMLRAIDNPTRDIDLAAVLKSPVFMFSLDDLIYVKKFNEKIEIVERDAAVAPSEKINAESGSRRAEGVTPYEKWNDPLFRYVRAYSENDDGIPELRQKCADFIAKLNIWRAKSRILPVDKFIWYLYRQTDIMAKISLESFAAERKANLMLLYEYARKFEETTFKGLYGFLNYLNDVQKEKDDFERAKVISENSDVVKIMSVHKAKGLEFPVCILANTSGLFNKSDYQGNPVISGDGVYFDLKYGDGIGIEKTPFKKLFSEKIKSDMMSEEARILYVALTRAIEKLIVVGNVDNIEKFLEKNTEIRDFSGVNNMLKWLAPILLNPDGSNKTNVNFDIDLIYADKLRKMIADSRYVGRDALGAPQIFAERRAEGVAPYDENEIAIISQYEEKIKYMYDFEYKKDFLSKIPAKISVSSLHPGMLTEDEYTAQALKETEMSPLPRFLEETVEKDPALSGTATHLFMQFADFEYAEVFGAVNEAENLLSRGFMTEAQFSRIRFYPIDRFFSSGLYGKIKSAKKVYRETPFNLKVSVNDFLETNDKLYESGGEYILIQGAIDLFFEDKNGKIYVVDFKTDQVHSPDGEKILIERHKRQIEYYCKAVREILGKPVENAYIYSFALNQAVPVV